jgi:hypothetical protein
MDSKRNHLAVMGAVLFLAAIVATSAAVFTGCGTTDDAAIRPMVTTPADEVAGDPIGEVVVPTPIHLLPTPQHAGVAFLGGRSVRLTWDCHQMGYITVITREGVEVGRVGGATEEYVDTLPAKVPHRLTYTLSYVSGLRQSQEVTLELEIPMQAPVVSNRPGLSGEVTPDTGN